VAVLVTVTLIGSIAATTLLLQQQASATQVPIGVFKKLTKQFQRDVLSLVSNPPPDNDRQLAMLFHDYEQETFRIFGLTLR
jgi:hypothetical protein